jgi:hypothetical protein
LDRIERLGNKVPHPAMIFAGLCVLVIVLSAVLRFFDVSVTYEVAEPAPVEVSEELTDEIEGGTQEPTPPGLPTSLPTRTSSSPKKTTEIQSLLTIDGIRFLFTSFVSNFDSFSVVAVILVAMLGVGVAEESGLMGALIRKLVKVAPAWAITFIIVFVGMLSSVASDAGYLILIPLAAAAFLSVGRHPLAGLAAAYAGVSAGFAVNILIIPGDGPDRDLHLIHVHQPVQPPVEHDGHAPRRLHDPDVRPVRCAAHPRIPGRRLHRGLPTAARVARSCRARGWVRCSGHWEVVMISRSCSALAGVQPGGWRMVAQPSTNSRV